MDLLADDRKRVPSEWLITLSVVTVLTLASLVLMLVCASPELSWDEADYAASTTIPWSSLYNRSDYERHNHGPMAIYLAKLGEDLWRGGTVPLELRLRCLDALAGSLGVGFLYWMLRRSFKTSRSAALAACSLLLLSVIRLEETNIIGPHHLMLACTLAIIGLGFQWRDRPTLLAALALGSVMAFGALSMTYVIPVAICWAVAVSLAGKGWLAWDRTHFRVSWAVPVLLATTVIVIGALWIPGVRHDAVIKDFLEYLHYPPYPTLVGDRIFESTPYWAVIYWLAHLDAPLLVSGIAIIFLGMWNAFKGAQLSSKHAYLAICLAFFLATMLAAHIAGARNMLQFIGVLCLATGALFDEALGRKPRLIRYGAATVIFLAVLNVAWLSRNSSDTPYLATDGYRAFLKGNENRLAEKSKALVYGLPILKFYAKQSGTPMAWDASEMPWTTRADSPLSDDVQYVLMPAFVYNDMPADQPMRRIVAEHWKVAWSYKAGRAWELRLYEKPPATAP